MTRLRHYDNLGTARFVTFSCYQRHPYFSDDNNIDLLLSEIASLRTRQNVKILEYVIMPEHVHLVLLPPDGMKLGPVLGQMKARTSMAIRKNSPTLTRSTGQSAVWQRRCYDHNCRLPATVTEKINYCHKNPVNRGLVNDSGEWPWSSYNWYQGKKVVSIEIDGFNL